MDNFLHWAPPTVYILCMLTCLACTALLLRGYLRSRTRLLLWSAMCFFGLSINNLLLYLDLHVVPSIDLTFARQLSILGSLLVLLYGLIWDSTS